MKSMNLSTRRCQVVPDYNRGIVFGLDISKDTITYRACRPDAASDAFTVNQDMAGFRKIEAAMRQWQAEDHDVWAGYEPTGPYSSCILEFLVERGYKVVQVNPKHTSKFNDIRDNAPGKDDGRDPFGMTGLIWQGCYRTPVHLTGVYAELRASSAEWAMLTVDGGRLRNQIHGLMRMWNPEMSLVFKNVLCKSSRALVRAYSSPEAMAQANVRSIRSILAKASVGRTKGRAKLVKDVMSQATGLVSGQKARHRSIINLLARLELVEEQKRDLASRMQKSLSMLDESGLLLSVKGIGVITTAIVLGECGDIAGYDRRQLEKLIGLNICERSSGLNKGTRKISKCGRANVRYALCVAATRMAGRNGIYHDVAAKMRLEGKKFGQIRIAVARKLLRLLHALAITGESFDTGRFVARRTTADDQKAHQDRRAA